MQSVSSDILVYIFTKLHPRDLCQARAVSKSWYKVGKYDTVWRHHVARVKAKLLTAPFLTFDGVTFPENQEKCYKMLLLMGYDPRCLLNWRDAKAGDKAPWVFQFVDYFDLKDDRIGPVVFELAPGITVQLFQEARNPKFWPLLILTGFNQEYPVKSMLFIGDYVKRYQRELDDWYF